MEDNQKAQGLPLYHIGGIMQNNGLSKQEIVANLRSELSRLRHLYRVRAMIDHKILDTESEIRRLHVISDIKESRGV